MAIDLKNAVAAWKKAKPLMLTKTGISEALRKIPVDPTIIKDFKKDLPVLEECKKVIDVAVSNKHIIAAKAAHECVKQIQEALRVQITKHRELRADVNAALKKIFDGGHKMVKTPTKQISDGLKSAAKEYDALFEKFTPASPEYVQVPMRVSYLAERWVESLSKPGPQLEGIKKEMTAYMNVHRMMAV